MFNKEKTWHSANYCPPPQDFQGISHFHVVDDDAWRYVSRFLRSLLSERITGKIESTVHIDDHAFDMIYLFILQMQFSYRSHRRDSARSILL